MNVYFLFYLLLNMLLYGRIFLYLHHPYYTGFFSVVRPPMEAFSSPMLMQISYVQYFYHSTHFYKYNSSYEWHCFYQLYSSIDLAVFLLFVHGLDVSSIFLSRYWIVIAGYLSMDLECSCIYAFLSTFLGRTCIFSYISWMNMLQALFRPLVRRIYLRLCFFLILRKACRRYVLASRDYSS